MTITDITVRVAVAIRIHVPSFSDKYGIGRKLHLQLLASSLRCIYNSTDQYTLAFTLYRYLGLGGIPVPVHRTVHDVPIRY